MITIKNSDLNDEVLDVILEIMDYELDLEISIKLTMISKEISKILYDNLSKRDSIYKNWLKKDESGNFLRDESGNFLIEDEKMLNKELNNLEEQETVLNFDKINPHDIFKDKVKPNKIMKILFLLKIEN